MYDSGIGSSDSATSVSVNADLGTALSQMLMAPEIQPGAAPSYQLCKTIYSYHPLGAVLADAPITRAQSQKRQIDVPVLGEKRLIEQFENTWDTLGKIGGTVIIHNLISLARVYGIASLAIGEQGKDPSTPLDVSKIGDAEIFFNVFDPLNTAGSLVLDQNPNSPIFLKPSGEIYVAGQRWHQSRLHIKMHEQPLFIEWSASAFGFVGRSIYQRALFAMKGYIQTMITDQMVAQKAGLLVAKMKTPGSFIDNVMQGMFGWKRASIKAGVTGQVLQIGETEAIETLNMQNLDKAAGFARMNIIKNIASAAGMPASIIAQETMTEGFGEGTEDAKKETAYLDYIREDMQPAYNFLDRICMRKAWTPAFYETLKTDYKEYRSKPYETFLHESMRAFKATWPNLLVEPDSEKSKTADVQFKAVVALVETIGPMLDAKNRRALIMWAAENANEREELFASKLHLDEDALEEHLEEEAEAALTAVEGEESGENEEPRPPRPMGVAS